MDETVGFLQIMNLAKDWPQFKNLHDFAEIKLIEANEKAGEHLRAAREKKAKDEADKKAKAEAEAAKQAEASQPKAVPAHKLKSEEEAEDRQDYNEPAEPEVERRV